MIKYEFQDLVEFAIKVADATDICVDKNTSLRQLGLYGDDAIDFILSYSQKFDVDVSKFDTIPYIEGEGYVIFDIILQNVFKVKSPLKDITLEHLEKGLIAGRLDEEVINS